MALLRLTLSLGLSIAALQAPDLSSDGHWPVKGRLLGKDGDKSKDVSGIACNVSAGFPRDCLVVDDNLQSAQRVAVFDGRIEAGAVVPLIADGFDGKPLELDGEGVAFAQDGVGRKFFYVMGSHGHPRDRKHKLDEVKDRELIAARIKAASQIVRLELADGELRLAGPIASLRGAIEAVKPLAPFVDKRLELDGVTVEGIAVAGGRLYAGFRSPSLFEEAGCAPAAPGDRPCALVLSVNLGGLFDGGALDPKPEYLRLGDRQGVRDLAPFRDGLLILSGPAGDVDGAYDIFWWDRISVPIKLATLAAPPTGADKKAEAILPLDEGPAGLRVLVLYDGAKEGAPSAMTIPSPR